MLNRHRMVIVVDPAEYGLAVSHLTTTGPHLFNLTRGEPRDQYMYWHPRMQRLWLRQPKYPEYDPDFEGPGVRHVIVAEWPWGPNVPQQGIYGTRDDAMVDEWRVWSRITHDFVGTAAVCRLELHAYAFVLATGEFGSLMSNFGLPMVERWNGRPFEFAALASENPAQCHANNDVMRYFPE
jgi:hypothetical protein